MKIRQGGRNTDTAMTGEGRLKKAHVDVVLGER
jgi:hypothetical protein